MFNQLADLNQNIYGMISINKTLNVPVKSVLHIYQKHLMFQSNIFYIFFENDRAFSELNMG